MIKQIRFMNINTNQTVQYGSNVQLNCFAQYYSEKVISKKKFQNRLEFCLFEGNGFTVSSENSLVFRTKTIIS